jgi:hypothetical protein
MNSTHLDISSLHSFPKAIGVLCLIALGFMPVQAQTAPPSTFNSVFQDAKAWGAATIPNTTSQISPAGGNNSVPYYSQPANSSSYFMGGKGSTQQPGLDKASTCATNPPTGSAYSQQECNAINFMQSSPGTRPQYTVPPTDPLIQAGGVVTSNPTAVLGTGTVGGTYTDCKATSVTNPSDYSTEVCHDYSVQADQTCIVGRTIVVDAHHLYQCAEQLFNQTNPICSIPREVVVDAKYNYQCDKSPNKLTSANCNRNLIVNYLRRTEYLRYHYHLRS